jgi:hypothetical protein
VTHADSHMVELLLEHHLHQVLVLVQVVVVVLVLPRISSASPSLRAKLANMVISADSHMVRTMTEISQCSSDAPLVCATTGRSPVSASLVRVADLPMRISQSQLRSKSLHSHPYHLHQTSCPNHSFPTSSLTRPQCMHVIIMSL